MEVVTIFGMKPEDARRALLQKAQKLCETRDVVWITSARMPGHLFDLLNIPHVKVFIVEDCTVAEIQLLQILDKDATAYITRHKDKHG